MVRYGFTEASYSVDENLGPLQAVLELLPSSGICLSDVLVSVTTVESSAECEYIQYMESIGPLSVTEYKLFLCSPRGLCHSGEFSSDIPSFLPTWLYNAC